MLPLGRSLSHFYTTPLTWLKVMIASRVIDMLYVQMCLVDILIIVRISSSTKKVDGRHLDFLGHVASMISLLKGVEKDDRDPLSEEPPICSTGGRGWPTSTSKGEL